MKWWALILTALLAVAIFAIAPSGCADDDDDDDDPPKSYGEDIEGIYSVTMTYEEFSCDEAQIGESEDWIIEIEQNGNFGWATVYYTEEGTGNEKVELLKAQVFGTVIMNAEITNDGSTTCVEFTAKNDYIKVDIDNDGTRTLSGRLTRDKFHQGDQCEGNDDCHIERLLAPASD